MKVVSEVQNLDYYLGTAKVRVVAALQTGNVSQDTIVDIDTAIQTLLLAKLQVEDALK